MEQISTFIEGQPVELRRLMQQIRLLILDAAPHITESIKWKIPFFAHQGLLCYLNPQAGALVLGFCRGALLSNEQGLLEGNGKEVRLLKIRVGSPLPLLEIRQLLQEAILVNETMQRQKNYYV